MPIGLIRQPSCRARSSEPTTSSACVNQQREATIDSLKSDSLVYTSSAVLVDGNHASQANFPGLQGQLLREADLRSGSGIVSGLASNNSSEGGSSSLGGSCSQGGTCSRSEHSSQSGRWSQGGSSSIGGFSHGGGSSLGGASSYSAQGPEAADHADPPAAALKHSSSPLPHWPRDLPSGSGSRPCDLIAATGGMPTAVNDLAPASTSQHAACGASGLYDVVIPTRGRPVLLDPPPPLGAVSPRDVPAPGPEAHDTHLGASLRRTSSLPSLDPQPASSSGDQQKSSCTLLAASRGAAASSQSAALRGSQGPTKALPLPPGRVGAVVALLDSAAAASAAAAPSAGGTRLSHAAPTGGVPRRPGPRRSASSSQDAALPNNNLPRRCLPLSVETRRSSAGAGATGASSTVSSPAWAAQRPSKAGAQAGATGRGATGIVSRSLGGADTMHTTLTSASAASASSQSRLGVAAAGNAGRGPSSSLTGPKHRSLGAETLCRTSSVVLETGAAEAALPASLGHAAAAASRPAIPLSTTSRPYTRSVGTSVQLSDQQPPRQPGSLTTPSPPSSAPASSARRPFNRFCGKPPPFVSTSATSSSSSAASSSRSLNATPSAAHPTAATVAPRASFSSSLGSDPATTAASATSAALPARGHAQPLPLRSSSTAAKAASSTSTSSSLVRSSSGASSTRAACEAPAGGPNSALQRSLDTSPLAAHAAVAAAHRDQSGGAAPGLRPTRPGVTHGFGPRALPPCAASGPRSSAAGVSAVPGGTQTPKSDGPRPGARVSTSGPGVVSASTSTSAVRPGLAQSAAPAAAIAPPLAGNARPAASAPAAPAAAAAAAEPPRGDDRLDVAPRRRVYRYSLESVCSDHLRDSLPPPRWPDLAAATDTTADATTNAPPQPHYPQEHSAASPPPARAPPASFDPDESALRGSQDELPLLASVRSPGGQALNGTHGCEDLMPLASPDPAVLQAGAASRAARRAAALGRQSRLCENWSWLEPTPTGPQHGQEEADGDGGAPAVVDAAAAVAGDTGSGGRAWHSVEDESDSDTGFGLPAWAWRSVAVLLSNDASSAQKGLTQQQQQQQLLQSEQPEANVVTPMLPPLGAAAEEDLSALPLRRMSSTPVRRRGGSPASSGLRLLSAPPPAHAVPAPALSTSPPRRPSPDAPNTALLFQRHPTRERYPSRHKTRSGHGADVAAAPASSPSLHSSLSDEPFLPLPAPADVPDSQPGANAVVAVDAPLLPLSAPDIDAMVLESLRLSGGASAFTELWQGAAPAPIAAAKGKAEAAVESACADPDIAVTVAEAPFVDSPGPRQTGTSGPDLPGTAGSVRAAARRLEDVASPAPPASAFSVCGPEPVGSSAEIVLRPRAAARDPTSPSAITIAANGSAAKTSGDLRLSYFGYGKKRVPYEDDEDEDVRAGRRGGTRTVYSSAGNSSTDARCTLLVPRDPAHLSPDGDSDGSGDDDDDDVQSRFCHPRVVAASRPGAPTTATKTAKITTAAATSSPDQQGPYLESWGSGLAPQPPQPQPAAAAAAATALVTDGPAQPLLSSSSSWAAARAKAPRANSLRRHPSLERLDGKLAQALQALRASGAAPMSEAVRGSKDPGCGMQRWHSAGGAAAPVAAPAVAAAAAADTAVVVEVDASVVGDSEAGVGSLSPLLPPQQLAMEMPSWLGAAPHDGIVVVKVARPSPPPMRPKDLQGTGVRTSAKDRQSGPAAGSSTKPPRQLAAAGPHGPGAAVCRRSVELPCLLPLIGAAASGAVAGASALSVSGPVTVGGGGVAAFNSLAAGPSGAVVATAAVVACCALWDAAAPGATSPPAPAALSACGLHRAAVWTVQTAGVAAMAALAADRVRPRLQPPAHHATALVSGPQSVARAGAVGDTAAGGKRDTAEAEVLAASRQKERAAAAAELLPVPQSSPGDYYHCGGRALKQAAEPESSRNATLQGTADAATIPCSPGPATSSPAPRTALGTPSSIAARRPEGAPSPLSLTAEVERRRSRVMSIATAAAEACAEAVATLRAAGCDPAALRRLARAYGVMAGMQLAADAGSVAALPATSSDWSDLQSLVRQRLSRPLTHTDHLPAAAGARAAALRASSSDDDRELRMRAVAVAQSMLVGDGDDAAPPGHDTTAVGGLRGTDAGVHGCGKEDRAVPEEEEEGDQLAWVAARMGEDSATHLRGELMVQAAEGDLARMLSVLGDAAAVAAQCSATAVTAASAEDAACFNQLRQSFVLRQREEALTAAGRQAADDAALAARGQAGEEAALDRLVRQREVLVGVCLAVEAAEAEAVGAAVLAEADALQALACERSARLAAHSTAMGRNAALAVQAAEAEGAALELLACGRLTDLACVAGVAARCGVVAVAAAEGEEAVCQWAAEQRDAVLHACFAVEATVSSEACAAVTAEDRAIAELAAVRQAWLQAASDAISADAALAAMTSATAAAAFLALTAHRQQRLAAVADAAAIHSAAAVRGCSSAGTCVLEWIAHRMTVLRHVSSMAGGAAAVFVRGGAAVAAAARDLVLTREAWLRFVSEAAGRDSGIAIASGAAEAPAGHAFAVRVRRTLLAAVTAQVSADAGVAVRSQAYEAAAVDRFVRQREVVAGLCLAVEAAEAAANGNALRVEEEALRALSHTRAARLAAHACAMGRSAALAVQAMAAEGAALEQLACTRRDELAAAAAAITCNTAASTHAAEGEEAAHQQLHVTRSALLVACFSVEAATARDARRAADADTEAGRALALTRQQRLEVLTRVAAEDAGAAVRAQSAEAVATSTWAVQQHRQVVVAVADAVLGEPVRWSAQAFLSLQQQRLSLRATVLGSSMAMLAAAASAWTACCNRPAVREAGSSPPATATTAAAAGPVLTGVFGEPLSPRQATTPDVLRGCEDGLLGAWEEEEEGLPPCIPCVGEAGVMMSPVPTKTRGRRGMCGGPAEEEGLPPRGPCVGEAGAMMSPAQERSRARRSLAEPAGSARPAQEEGPAGGRRHLSVFRSVQWVMGGGLFGGKEKAGDQRGQREGGGRERSGKGGLVRQSVELGRRLLANLAARTTIHSVRRFRARRSQAVREV